MSDVTNNPTPQNPWRTCPLCGEPKIEIFAPVGEVCAYCRIRRSPFVCSKCGEPLNLTGLDPIRRSKDIFCQKCLDEYLPRD